MSALKLPAVAILLTITAFFLGACGKPPSTIDPNGQTEVTLILDYLPNAIHTGIFHAEASGYFEEAGIALDIDKPTSTSDTLRLMAAGRADFGLVPFVDFLKARAAGEPVTIVAAMVQKPLAAIHVPADSGIERPRDLEGKTVGVTGVSSDEATVAAIVASDGGDPATIRTINIGFNVVQSLVAGRVDGAVGFWNHEGVQLEQNLDGGVRLFKEDEWGVPPYPGLVMFARTDTLEEKPEAARAFLAAIHRGYAESITDTNTALTNLANAIQGTDKPYFEPYFEALRPVFFAEGQPFGYFQPEQMTGFLPWAREYGIVTIGEAPEALYSNDFLPEID